MLEIPIQHIEKIIVCTDYNYEKVLFYLNKLFFGQKEIINKFESLKEYRKKICNKKFKSAADNFVKKVRKSLKKKRNWYRQNAVLNYAKYIEEEKIERLISLLLKHETEEMKIYTEEQKSFYKNAK